MSGGAGAAQALAPAPASTVMLPHVVPRSATAAVPFAPLSRPLAERHARDWRRRRQRPLRRGVPLWQTPTRACRFGPSCTCQFGPISVCTCQFASVCACHKLKRTPQLPTDDAQPKRRCYVRQRFLPCTCRSCSHHQASHVGPPFAPLLSEVAIDANAVLSLVTPPSCFPVHQGCTIPPSPCPATRPVKGWP